MAHPTKFEAAKLKPLHRILGVVLVALAVLVSVSLLVIIAAFIYLPFQKPDFVNKDLELRNKLKIPALLQPHLENGEKVFDLTVQQGETAFLAGKQTKTMGYNGSYLGPTIRAHKGDKVRMNVTNHLPDPTTAHWHGMELPAAMDGAAHQTIKTGENWQPYWTVANQAASLWYHSHLTDKTGEQVYRGLGGMFIIDDDNTDALALPKDYGIDDLPLIVQDRQFDDNDQFVYRSHDRDIFGHTGMHGDKILVNGTYAPYANVPAKQIRLRILNASNARRYNFGFADGHTFYQIASDSGLLEKPVARTQMVLAPGERAEIVIDLTNETKPLTLVSSAFHEDNIMLRVAKNLAGANRDENQQFKILELRPHTTSATSNPLPKQLNTIQKLKASDAVITRDFILDSSQTINSKKMDHSRIDHIAHTGTIEIWKIRNQSGSYHPFHIHGVQFQVLDRNGTLPPEYEQGWKDTIAVANGETVQIIMRMPEYSDSHLPYMFHCHILEHEDMGMMGQFVVVDKDTDPKDIFVHDKMTQAAPMDMYH